MALNLVRILRRVNTSLQITVPKEYVKRHELQGGDHVVWIEDEEGVRIKFVKLSAIEDIAA